MTNGEHARDFPKVTAGQSGLGLAGHWITACVGVGILEVIVHPARVVLLHQEHRAGMPTLRRAGWLGERENRRFLWYSFSAMCTGYPAATPLHVVAPACGLAAWALGMPWATGNRVDVVRRMKSNGATRT
ncbi:hypothetical protein GCM10025762_47760 [Haloechinothrix salitolerans]